MDQPRVLATRDGTAHRGIELFQARLDKRDAWAGSRILLHVLFGTPRAAAQAAAEQQHRGS